jgi:hypothetical protein
MTGNLNKGKNFGAPLDYNLEKVEQGVAEILAHTFANTERNTILGEVAIIKAQRPNLQRYFYHTSVNFPPHEHLANDQMKQIGKEYLEMNGFIKHQYIIFRHYDAKHPHLHIIVNRIGYDGMVHSDSNDYAKSEKVLRQLEIRHGLTQVQSSKHSPERAVTKDELEMMKRMNEPSGKLKLQVLVKKVIGNNAKLSTAKFIKALEAKGINVKFNQATTGYVSGISYRYEGFITTGVKLGHDYKWSEIKRFLDYNQERDRQVIHEANQRSVVEVPKDELQRTRRAFRNIPKFKELVPETGFVKVLGELLENGPGGTAHHMEERIDQEVSSYYKKKKKQQSRGMRM